MRITCAICQHAIEDPFIPPPAEMLSGSTEEEKKQFTELLEFDRAAMLMNNHIDDEHRGTAERKMQVAMQAAKTYAMNYADLDPAFDHVRRNWRAQLLMSMSTAVIVDNWSQRPAVQAATPEAAGGSED